MAAKPSKELLAYAFIAQEYGASGSALDGVSQLLAHIVGQKAGRIFSPQDTAEEVASTLGLELSPLVVESLVPALVRLGALEQIASADGVAAYKCKRVADAAYSLGEAEIDEILGAFRNFAVAALSKHNLAATDAELDEAFLSFLVTADFLSSWLQSDKSEFKGNVLSLKKDESLPAETKRDRSLDTVCALFAQEAFSDNKALFNKLVEISWGAVVVEVVTALQVGASGESSPLSDLTVFVDTPILLDLLELGEAEQHRYAMDLFDLLRRSQANIATFSHVVEEMRSAVETTLNRFSRGEPFSGPMAKRLRSEKGYELYARQAIALLESKLASQGVDIVADAELEERELQKYFPEDHVDSLRSRVGELHRNVERRDRDAKSIAYVVRMRRGLTASPVSLSKFVFVTRNVALCRIATRYSQNSGLIARGTAPPCVTDRQLAGVLWFCSGAPAGEGVAMTRQKIIANSANAVAPRLDLVSKMGQVLFENRPDRLLEYEALMRDQRAALCLTRETLNVASLLDAHQAEDLLDRMRQELTAEQREAFSKERDELVASFEREKKSILGAAATSTEKQVKRAREEGAATLDAVHKVVAELRADHANEKERLDAALLEVSRLARERETAKSVVHDSVATEIKVIAVFLAILVILVYGLIAWAVQSMSGIPLVGFLAMVIFSMLGFWIVPEYALHPVIKRILTTETNRRLRRIKGYSGLELDQDAIVNQALASIRLGRAKVS